MEGIKQGSIISGANWPEPVEVKLIEEVEEFEGYIRIVGTTTSSRSSIDDVISRDELSKCTVMGTGSALTEDPGEVFLALEAIRYRFAFLYDPLLAMNASKVDPLPHQIEAVYGHVLRLPRIRFLIADDPGAGKTIMAGLIIKELKLRNLAKRILIVAPGHLKDQWRRELDDRFEEKFIVIDRGLLDAHYAENVWGRESQVITSIDFAKREDIIPSISSVHFDLIIVDEAHKMSAYRYGDKTDKTSRYRLGEVLSGNTDHFLFLTATPHKGDPDNFRLFLDLLEPGFFATNEMLQESIRNDENRLFIRRVKEDLKDFEGNPLFLPRHVTTVPFNLGTESPNEKELYNELSRYVNTQYNKALTKDKRRNVAFALVILQRRLASSTYALRESLRRRKKRLQELLEGAQERARNSDYVPDSEAVEDSSEEERWEQEAIWETLSVSENRQELAEEIRTIEELIARADSIIQNEEEIKLKELRSCLVELAQKYPEEKDKKILIFTESKDTLDYLEEKIKLWGYSVNTIHGGMRLEERVAAESIFHNETQVMVATEAAGEGINLQFCHLMLNYDIPWNPNRLEQRMGRIHRYGQQKEVYVFNLVAEDTREGRVLNALFDKLEEIRNALGSDKVFDVLSEVLYGKSLSQILIDAAANARDIDDILKEIDIEVDEEYIAEVKENLGESLATRYIDYTRIKEMAQEAREQRLIPEYTESFFRKAFLKAGGSLRDRADGFLAIDSIPYNIRRLADDDAFKRRYGELVRRYPRATFDKEMAFKNPDAEFISFGHPLFESIMAWIESSFSDSPLNGGTFADPDGRLDGYILFYEGEIKDGTGAVAGKRLFGFYTNSGQVSPIFPAVIWDLEEKPKAETESVDIDLLKRKTSGNVILELEQYKKEILKERDRQTEIKRKYGVKSLEHLIWQLDGDIISLYDRKEKGENVDLVIRNKEERKEEYEKALHDLREQIQKERSLTMGMPRFVGIIRVEPSDRIADGMATDPESERIAMEVSMEYERRNGREPEDVSGQNLGFDIRSKDGSGDKRRIEVKGRTGTGAVELTQNEWFKAKSLKDDYYLYAVMNTATKPQLYIIQNPAENLAAKEKIDVRYLVPFGEIVAKGDTAGE
jgi:superfamily II DNA or RNA helicase